MYDDDLQEQEKKSLLKDMAKKGISKTIEAMPLKTKLIIIGIISGIVLFLLILVAIITPVYMLLGDSKQNNDSNLVYVESNSEDNYWWPVGGSEMEEKNGIQFATGTPTANYYNSANVFNLNRVIDGISSPHPAIDISGGNSQNYIIAVSKGVVYSANDSCDNNGSFGNTCGGGGYGNYVILKHSGDVYTIYAHLYPNSITVSQGDTVEQGQIIGIMGNSGSSKGTHLHFQIEVGGRSQSNAVNPLDYISAENPRPVTISSGTGSSNEIAGNDKMLAMLLSWEGGDQYSDGEYWTVFDDGYGYLSVGHGIALEFNIDKFKKRGIDVSSLKAGSKIKKSIVDEIEAEIVEEKKQSVISTLENNNITLEQHQVDALVIRIYNVGNISKFPEYYNKYGNTQALYDNFMGNPVTSNDVYSFGLDRRRQAEWNLFHNGIYTHNS